MCLLQFFDIDKFLTNRYKRCGQKYLHIKQNLSELINVNISLKNVFRMMYHFYTQVNYKKLNSNKFKLRLNSISSN